MEVNILFIVINYYFSKKKPDPKTISKNSYGLLVIFLLIIGIYSNFMAAGEGAFSRMGMMAILGLTFLQSQGIKAVATMPSRVYSLIVTAFAGLIVWPYLVTFWVAGFFAGKYATKYVKYVPDVFMKNLLVIFSLGFIFYLLFAY